MSGVATRLTVVVGLLVVILAGGIVAADTTENRSVTSMEEVNVSAQYDPSSPAQTATVNVTVAATDSALRDVQIDVGRADETLVVPDSFRTTIIPSNQEVNVTPVGRGGFETDRLDPGETITIQFQVALETLEPTTVDAAWISVTYTQRGQRLSQRYEPTADIAANPWHERAQPAGDTGPFANPTVLSLVGLTGTVLGATIVYFRRPQSVSWDAIEPAFSRARRRVDDSVALTELDRLESSVKNEVAEPEEDSGETEEDGSEENLGTPGIGGSSDEKSSIDDDMPKL
ncbi:hypothetical protein [Haloarchaeobius iranensis]|uniref:Uncharacterized protein n=1 Tax=Haloarchaeobius iranensis TaxID=996166 RepID=A0A1H0A2G0_9EURY|nr:hypothetical protein [Haloarchaeobius iranensis]SDN27635.1 hypothetical protein SAMN05192554_12422 [Haloarchaeobius iranensis]